MATMKHEGYIIKKLDQYLLGLNAKDEDRRWDINSPSSAGGCNRSRVYSRLNYERDANSVGAKTRRVFDNGTHTHLRLQQYMLDCGLLLMDEVPVFDDPLEVQGHTDGLLELTKFEVGILEIKSINTDDFRKLKDAKEEHKLQAQVYMTSLEKRRKAIRAKCKTKEELDKYLKSPIYKKFIYDHYKHVKGGSHYTREEKLKFKLEQHQQADRILWNTPRPINKMVFLYEDKNSQELQEFTVKWDDSRVKAQEQEFKFINDHVKRKKIPPRPEGATSKSCNHCRWCNFKSECWIV
jgi:hypothetical protein